MSAVQIPQSTSRVVMLKLFLTGTTTPATGKTLAVVLSKNGAAFANPSAGATNATEVANGWYSVTLSTTDTGTVGDLVVRGTATGCDDSERVFAVVKATTGGLTALPDTAASTNASLLTSGTGTDQLSVSAGKVLLQATQTGVTIPTVTTVGTLTTYTGNTPQTGDSFARLGAPAGASVSADLAGKPTLAQILAGGDVDGFTLEQTLKLCLAALAGKLSGAAGTTITIRASDDSKARITATVDASGNRTAVTLDATG